MIGRQETFSTMGPNAAIEKPVSTTLKASTAVLPRCKNTGALNNTRRIVPSNGNTSTPNKHEAKEIVKYLVKYVTKQVYICPTQPILIVEKLPYLEYHVNELTKRIGKRPCLYLQGKRVQIVPESREEHATIQRYLAQLETEEGIVWCSSSLPPGSGLKVNVVERVVKVVKIVESL